MSKSASSEKESSKIRSSSVSNYKKSTTCLIQVAEAFPLQTEQLDSNSQIPIQRVPNPHFDPVSSALEQQCNIQSQKQPQNKVNSPEMSITPTKQSSTTRLKRRSISLRNQGSVEKRNQRERNRVNTVNQAFQALRSNLPSLKTSTKRVSKLRILKAAINYIYTLNDHIDGIIDPQNNTYSPISSSNVSSGASPTNFNNPVTSSSSPPIQQSLQFSNTTIGTQINTSAHQIINTKPPIDSSLSSLINQAIPITSSFSSQQPFLNFPSYIDYQEMATYVYRTNLHT